MLLEWRGLRYKSKCYNEDEEEEIIEEIVEEEENKDG